MAKLSARLVEVSSGYAVEATGLRLLAEPTKARWAAIGRDLTGRTSGLQWAFGDWLVAHRGEWGDRYTQAEEITGFGADHLGELFATAKAWPRDKREIVSAPWSFFRIAKSAPDKEAALRRAVAKGWDCRRLTSWIHEANLSKRPALPQSNVVRMRPTHEQHVTCPHCGRTFPIKGHRVKPERSK